MGSVSGQKSAPRGLTLRSLKVGSAKLDLAETTQTSGVVKKSRRQFFAISAPGRAVTGPGPTDDDPGRKTGPREGVESSGARALKKSRRRRSGSPPPPPAAPRRRRRPPPPSPPKRHDLVPDLRHRDFFKARAPELSTPSPGPVFRPGSFFVGPGAQYGPPRGRLMDPNLRRREKSRRQFLRYFGPRESRVGPRGPQRTTRGGKPVPGKGSRALGPAPTSPMRRPSVRTRAGPT